MDVGRNNGVIHAEKDREMDKLKNDGEKEIGKNIVEVEDAEK